MTDLVGHFLLFTVLGVVFLLLPLVVGLFVRPTNPTNQKLAAYECGEPTIGSSYVQFDLRFYVVALLFIIFDVEVAFFFPWALIYGEATQLADPRINVEARQMISAKLLNATPSQAVQPIGSGTAFRLAALTFFDILVFFGVLLVGFAYVWKRGDLNWVRAVTRQSTFPAASGTPRVAAPEPMRVPQTVG
jgi:NADH-quinone oxidoreductase subunit A